MPDEPVYNGEQGGGDNSICGQQYSACAQSAYASFMMSATLCVATGIGIGVGSSGWAAPVGGAVAGACYAAAEIQYDASLKQCYYTYLQCKKN